MPKNRCSLAAAALMFSALPLAVDAATPTSLGHQSSAHMIKVAAYVANPSAPLGSTANPIPENSPTPAALAYKIVPSDPALVTNGPIPDTAANRAKYGEPMSHAGRLSDPAGN